MADTESNCRSEPVESDRAGELAITREGLIHDCDRAAARLLQRAAGELRGVAFRTLLAPADRPRFDEFLRALFGGRPQLPTGIELHTAGASPVTLRLDAVHAPAVAVDGPAALELRARARPAGAAAVPEPTARAIADALPAMVAYWSRSLRCSFANKAYLEWFGRAPEQVVGLDMRELLGAELFRRNEPYVRGALRGEVQGFERTLTKANGEVGYTWAQYVPQVVDGVVQGFFVLVSDITALKLAEAAARENEARFRAVIDASPVAYVLSDASQNITYLNPAFNSTFGYTRDDLPTLAAWWQAAIANEADRARSAATWQARTHDARAAHRPFEPMELAVRCKDGGERIVVVHAAPLGGAIAGADLIALRDVTDERRLERELLQTATREQHRLGIALHESLAQDLVAASMMLDALCRRPDTGSADSIRAELAELAGLLRSCVGNVRTMAQDLSPVELHFGGLHGALERLGESARTRRQLDVVVRLSGLQDAALEPLVAEHAYRIAREAVLNVLAHSRATRLALEATLAPDRLTLVVRDDGIGLAAGASSSGPGFRTMRYRARAVGGRIDVEAVAGGGTLVRFACPLPGAGTPPEAAAAAAERHTPVTRH